MRFRTRTGGGVSAWFNARPSAPVEPRTVTRSESPPSGFSLAPPFYSVPATIGTRFVTGLEPVDMEASFAGGIRVQLRFEQGARWSMWVSNGGRWTQRKAFA